jgi:hypothetical protein
MNPLVARQHLSRAARQHLQERGLKLSVPGRLYLSLLLTRGAIRVAGEGDDSMKIAEENLRLLLDEAAHGTGAPAGRGTPAV